MSSQFSLFGDCDDGGVELIHGDCRSVIAAMPDGRVDAVICDIPYSVVNRSSGGLRKFDKGDADIETFDLKFVAEQACRLAAQSVYVWCSTEQVSELRGRFVDLGMTTRLCIWQKSNPSPVNGEKMWLSGVECCVFARKPKAFFNRHCKVPVWVGPVARGKLHPTQKPVWLMREQVDASVPESGSVLDFCMGSGSTGVACVELGRKFIGIEMNDEWFRVASDRISVAAKAGGRR